MKNYRNHIIITHPVTHDVLYVAQDVDGIKRYGHRVCRICDPAITTTEQARDEAYRLLKERLAYAGVIAA